MFGIFGRKPPPVDRPSSADELKDRGNRLLAGGSPTEALACYREAIAADPGFAAGYLNLGYVLDQQGRHDDAEHALDRAVALDPALADAWYILGTIAQARGQRQAAIERFMKALEADPRLDVAYPNLLQVLVDAGQIEAAKDVLAKGLARNPRCANLNYFLGKLLARAAAWDEAADRFRSELALQPDFAEAHFELAEALRRKGAPAEAVDAYRAALTRRPDWAEAHQHLGMVFATLGDLAQATRCYRRALELAPDYVDAHNNLGVALQEQGEIEAAIESFRNALAIKPDFANVHYNLGVAFHQRGRTDLATEHYERALAFNPDFAPAHHNLGSFYLTQGNRDAAVACYREALRIDPNFAEAHQNLGNAFQSQGDTEAAMRSFRRAMAIDPGGPAARHAHSSLIVATSAYDASSSAAYLREARQFGESARVRARPYAHGPAGPAERPLRVGFVSGDFGQHPVGFFLEGVVAQLALRRLRLFAYSTTWKEDALTARIKPCFHEWTVIAGLSDEAAARNIHGDEVDVLIDLAGHTTDNRLTVFAWQPAPIQASWLGYWASTGMPGIDYFLADRVAVPPGREAEFSEAIWYIPETRMCFTPPGEGTRLAVTALPAVRNGHVTFACFQNLGKVSDTALALWGRILRAQPAARLRVQNQQLGYPGARELLQRRLADAGIAAERVTMHGRMPRDDYLATYADVDVVLDTFPYSGGTTTCEALWMGVPTLTLAGYSPIARQSASMNACVGLSDWIADDDEAYAAKAASLPGDLRGLEALRAGLRERVLATPLFDARRFADSLEDALYRMTARKRDVPIRGGPAVDGRR